MANALKTPRFPAFTVAATFAAVASLSSVSIPAQAALFNTCKNVRITIHNNTNLPIEARYLRVYDPHSEDWDTEQLTNKKIMPGSSYTYRENLADVGGKAFTLKPYYKSLRQTSSGAQWSSTVAGSSQDFSRCDNAGSYALTIGNSGPSQGPGADMFRTRREALRRARQIRGCRGEAFSRRLGFMSFWMPCRNLQAYQTAMAGRG
ncbi:MULTISPECIES: hypothetical protein [Aphanothece]|uniref:hypothetical protein n=1 Tax=Aphanothece TaxID=1121 RepID=UPI003984C92A